MKLQYKLLQKESLSFRNAVSKFNKLKRILREK